MTTRIAHTIDLTLLEPGAEGGHYVTVKPASDRQIDVVMKAPVTSMDGRSNWLLFTLPNGDLIFGCYPEGDTYEEVVHGGH